MDYSKITFDISSTGKCPPCLQSFRSGSQSLGLPHPHPLLQVFWPSCLKVWLTAGSFLQRDLPVPFFMLCLLLVGCVMEPVQLAEQTKPNLTAVACCCVKPALQGPSQPALVQRRRKGCAHTHKEGERNGAALWWWEAAFTISAPLLEVYARNSSIQRNSEYS